MVEFHLVYNPYRVETALSVKLESRWVPVNEDSGLLHIGKSRMQRWLEAVGKPCGRCYFDELFEASGERELKLWFTGTREDLEDISEAARCYHIAHPDFSILVRGDETTAHNSSAQKLTELRNILSTARRSGFHYLLPNRVWNYMDQEILNPASVSAKILPLSQWKKGTMFEPGAWQMLCLSFPFQESRGQTLRQQFLAFAECMDQTGDRDLERERFLLLCQCQEDAIGLDRRTEGVIEKLLMEYGLQDLRVLYLTSEELDNLSIADGTTGSERFQAAYQAIAVYDQRYAEQYRVRKMHDVLQQTLREEGYDKKSKTMRKIEEIMRTNRRTGKQVSDSQVLEAYKWVNGLLERLNHLLDVDGAVQDPTKE